MYRVSLLVLCLLNVSMVMDMPIQLLRPQQLPLQEQLKELQNVRPYSIYQQPFTPTQILPMVLFPMNSINTYENKDDNNFKINEHNGKKTPTKDHFKNHDKGDEDSVVIENNENEHSENNLRNGIVMPDKQRFFLGPIIEAIPWLPIEINVPDTISWAWNGISGVIGGIGQRLPFRPKPQIENLNEDQSVMTKMLLKRLVSRPLNMPAMPMPFAIMPILPIAQNFPMY